MPYFTALGGMCACVCVCVCARACVCAGDGESEVPKWPHARTVCWKDSQNSQKMVILTATVYYGEDTDENLPREEMHRTESKRVPGSECPDVLIRQNRKSRVLLELHHVGMTDHPRG